MRAPLNFNLFPPQAKALQTKATEVLFGGGAGGGKSHLLRIAAIVWCLMIPGLRVGLFRRLFPDLKANHIDSTSGFPAMLAKGLEEGWCEIVRNEVRFWNGSRISLNHCQHEKDKLRYQGAEFHVLLIDEITHFTESIYTFLRGRVRVAGVELSPPQMAMFPRIMVSGNPGSIGHAWVKRTWIDNGPWNLVRAKDEEGGMLRQYIPSTLTDNPAMTKTDPNYRSRLMGLGDPMLVRAMLEGDWDVVAGAMFGDTWRRERHVMDPFAIPMGWEIWRGADDGFAAPAACLWLTQHPTWKTIYVIAELYKDGMLAPEYAQHIKDIDGAIPRYQQGGVIRNTDVIDGLLDNEAWSDHGQGEIARGNQILKHGVKFRPVEKWQGSRIHGAQNIHRLLAPNALDPHKMPGLRIFSRCKNLLACLPAIPRDPRNAEDTDRNYTEDHIYDALRYGLQWRRVGGGAASTSGT